MKFDNNIEEIARQIILHFLPLRSLWSNSKNKTKNRDKKKKKKEEEEKKEAD